MKRTISMLSVLLLCASVMTGCGTTENESSAPETPEQVTVQTTASTATAAQTTAVTETETTAKSTTTETTQDNSEAEALTQVQENSIAWLNYLAMLSQEINESQHSKMFLEEAYAAIINNTNPANVNELTESYLVNLLDIIEKYRMIEVKRERLEYLYEQNKARAFRQALPNPTALLSASVSVNPTKLMGAMLYMAVDSYDSYKNYNDELNMQYLKDGWELDDEAADNIHDNRKKVFQFMLEMVREYNLPDDLALNEQSIEEFVKFKKSNLTQQKQFLESNEKTYRAFGSYWLQLAECYYQSGEYPKCLDCIEKYETLNTNIFRKDYYLARTLPYAITSAYEVLPEEKYIETAERYLQIMLQNLDNDEWSLRYYAAEMYVYLYGKTNKEEYLQSAYDLLLNNVNHMIEKQNELNDAYLGSIKKISAEPGATDKEKEKVDDYNESLEKKRKTELPTVYEPLAINCELLITVAEKLNIPREEQLRIEGILKKDDDSVFLTIPIRNHLSFRTDKSVPVEAEFMEDKLILPVICVAEGAEIKVTVTSGDKSIEYNDWKIDEVSRSKSGINAYRVTYTSEKIEDCEWYKNSTVKVEILNTAIDNCEPVIVNFKVKSMPSWYNDLWDDVEFEQVY